MDYSLLTDEELARRFVAGDLTAYETLVERYSRPIFNFVYRFIGNYDDANDLSQLVFLQAYTHLERARLDQPLRPWLYQIARNKAIDLLRSRNQIRFSDLKVDEDDLSPVDLVADESPLPEAVVEQKDLQRVLAEAISALPAKYREVVAMRYGSDLTFREIGDSLDLPENTVKTLFQRAKALLRRYLEGQI